MKRFLLLCITLMVLLGLWITPASASIEDRAFSEDLKQFGQWLGEGIESFGNQVAEFSKNPADYFENNDTYNEWVGLVEQKAKEMGDHWPVFKSSVESGVAAVFNSDLSWEEKKAEIEKYGVLAMPFLAEIDFEQAGDNAKAAMETLKEFLGTDSEEVVKEWIEKSRQNLEAFGEYLSR